jgi:hypothetical protein
MTVESDPLAEPLKSEAPTETILVMGNPYWADVAAGMLRRMGYDAQPWTPRVETLPAALRWCRPLRWLGWGLSGPFRGAAAVHVIAPAGQEKLLRLARLMGKRVLLHWVGTDVLNLKAEAAARGPATVEFYRRMADANFADAPELIEELAALGLTADLFRLLPDAVEPRDMPLPERPAVLSYWSPGRRDFYGGPTLDALADAFPDVPFLIVGTDGRGEPQHPNMKYLGRLEDLEAVYAQVSVLVRLPEHDSLSAMVLEMLGRGRQVIYSKPFPNCEYARSLDEAMSALRLCLARSETNKAGRAYVGENFSPAAEVRRVAPFVRRALGTAV